MLTKFLALGLISIASISLVQAYSPLTDNKSVASAQAQRLAQTQSSEVQDEIETIETSDSEAIERTIQTSLDNREQASITVRDGENIPFYTGSNESTVTIARGGSISHLSLADSAKASIEGEASHASLEGDSTISVFGSGSNVGHLTLNGQTRGKISEGASISHLNLNDDATGEITGGTFSFINLGGRSEVEVRSMVLDGGSFITPDVNVSGGAITLAEDSTLTIYGRDMRFESGVLLGSWADGTSFSLSLLMLRNAGTEQEIFEVPDAMPAQVVLHEVS